MTGSQNGTFNKIGPTMSEAIRNGFHLIEIDQGKPSFVSYASAAFLGFWLCGWTVGGFAAMGGLFAAEGGAKLFMTFWLGGWAIGWFFAARHLYRFLQGSQAQQLLLAKPELAFDSGRAPVSLNSRSAFWQSSEKQRQERFARDALKSLALREGNSRNRLTLDHKGERIDLAKPATDIEREWLYGRLVEVYGLAPR